MDLAEVRHIADGFIEDADVLLDEFHKLETFDYKAFAKIWKKRLFSLVYMGRETENELFEFTQEIFAITLNYLKPSVSIYRRTGAVYMLYGLYIKQPLESKCKIRIVTEQWMEIQYLYKFAKRENIKCLGFSILKLLSLKAFHCVAFNKLMGPKSTMTWELLSDDVESIRSLKHPLEAAIVTNDFEDLSSLHNEYESKVKEFTAKTGIKMSYELPDNKYKTIERDLEELLKAENFDDLFSAAVASTSGASRQNIGNRRSELKRKQFRASCKNQLKTRMNQLLGSSGEEESSGVHNILKAAAVGRPSVSTLKMVKTKVNKKKKRNRPPKGERKRGRPKKEAEPPPSEDDDDEEDEGEEETQWVMPCGRRLGEKPRRVKQHYENDAHGSLREATLERKYGKRKVLDALRDREPDYE